MTYLKLHTLHAPPLVLRDSNNVVIAEVTAVSAESQAYGIHNEQRLTFRLSFPNAIDETSVDELTDRIRAMLLTLAYEHRRRTPT